jgi:hypothetical protein
VLCLEKPCELFVGHLDLELAEEQPHLRRILDLLHEARREESRQVRVAKALGQVRHGLAPACAEPRRVPGFE